MRTFKDLNINLESKNFVGDKISIDRILNREVIVHDYKVEPSKIKIGTKCLYLQIALGETKHVVFTGSGKLLEQIEKAVPEDFPFKATIVKKENRAYHFS